MKLSIGFSPCPNDTFIFDALVNNKIDHPGIELTPYLEDVETLNQWALEGKLDITKLSYGVYPLVSNQYQILNSGSALGSGVGPLLISNHAGDQLVDNYCIAIPGEHTTAHLLFSLAYPNAKNKVFLRYNEIEEFVLAGKGLGVIIHENRFTYSSKGLHKITDLGDYWEKTTGSNIPLGGIVIRQSLDTNLKLTINQYIRNSIEYAYSHHYKILTDYVKMHSQEMSEEVMRKHIDLYVNQYSIELGTIGQNAIQQLISVYQDSHGGENNAQQFFVQEASITP